MAGHCSGLAMLWQILLQALAYAHHPHPTPAEVQEEHLKRGDVLRDVIRGTGRTSEKGRCFKGRD